MSRKILTAFERELERTAQTESYLAQEANPTAVEARKVFEFALMQIFGSFGHRIESALLRRSFRSRTVKYPGTPHQLHGPQPTEELIRRVVITGSCGNPTADCWEDDPFYGDKGLPTPEGLFTVRGFIEFYFHNRYGWEVGSVVIQLTEIKQEYGTTPERTTHRFRVSHYIGEDGYRSGMKAINPLPQLRMTPEPDPPSES